MTPIARLAVAAGVALAAGPAAGQDPAGRRFAVLVGVNDYDHPRLAPLKYATNDVTALGKALTAGGYKVTLLTDEAGRRAADLAPTKANVDANLRAVLRECRRGDTVVVGLAGHGLQFEGDKDAYFCPSDARPSLNGKDSLVSLSKLYADLDDSFAGVKVLFVDACRDDPTAGRGARGVDADTAPSPPRGVAALFSCGAGQRAFEHDALRHGVFFHHVLQGLAKAADDRGRVKFNRLADYVADKVPDSVTALVGGGAKQSPNQKGEFVGGSPVLLTEPAEWDAAASADGRLVVRAGRGRVAVHDVRAGRAVWAADLADLNLKSVGWAAFSPTGDVCLVSAGRVVVVGPAGGDPRWAKFATEAGGLGEGEDRLDGPPVFSPDGTQVGLTVLAEWVVMKQATREQGGKQVVVAVNGTAVSARRSVFDARTGEAVPDADSRVKWPDGKNWKMRHQDGTEVP